MVSDDWQPSRADNQDMDAMDICDAILANTYAEMQKINAYNGSTGLYPDWVDTADDPSTPAVEGVRKCKGTSDRVYYQQQAIPENVNKLYLDMSLDTNGNGELEYSEGRDLQSFNFYYDSVRVPWRLAMDYSLFGNSDALAMATEMADFFQAKRTGPHPANAPRSGIVDGYEIDGTDWILDDKDGFNMGEGGTSESVTFIAMCATAAMVKNDLPNAQAFYKLVQDNRETTSDPAKYHYYGNCVRLLSLLYMSGRMVNLYEEMTRAPSAIIAKGPLTIDTAYTDYAANGSNWILLNDRSTFFNADRTAYANVASGLKGVTYDGNDRTLLMNVGYNTAVNGAVCGLPYGIGRFSSVKDYFIGAGVVYRNDFSHTYLNWPAYEHYIDHFPGELGLMDYRVDMSLFTPDLSNNINVENGASKTILPGNYGTVTVMNNVAKLYLSGGIYHMDSFATEPDAKIYFDTGSKPIVVFVKNGFNIASRTKFLQSGEKGANPARILFVVGTSSPIAINPQVNWRGTLIAPNSVDMDVNLHNPFGKWLSGTPNPKLYETLNANGEGFGAFWGKGVEIHQDSAVYFTRLNWTEIAALSESGPGAPGTNYDESQYSEISAPFSKDGIGEYFWMTNSLGNAINLWGLDDLNINGQPYEYYTPSASIPVSVDVYKYYIHYKSVNAWGHFQSGN
jgi:hypothetical protein